VYGRHDELRQLKQQNQKVKARNNALAYTLQESPADARVTRDSAAT